MLLDERQAMVNDLSMAYRESSGHYADALELLERAELDEGGLGELFANLRASHEETVGRLRELARESNDLPRAPDADREGARQLLTRLKAALAGDRRRIILEERIADEKRIAARLEEALQLDFPADTRTWLGSLQGRQREIVARLDAALEAG